MFLEIKTNHKTKTIFDLLLGNVLTCDVLNISGFIKMFSNVAHFTLDLSNNKLETLPADVLYENASNWEHTGTQILKGNKIFSIFSC